MNNSLKGKISGNSNLKGNLNNAIEKIYPELENLEVTPSGQEQHFKSDMYGYDEVTVYAVESEELNIMPSAEEQINEGLFNKVTVEGEPNLVPDNIAKGVNMFGVEGAANIADFKITNGRHLFYEGARLEYMQEILGLCEGIVSANAMFYYCDKVTELDVSKLDTSKCTNMNSMFRYCRNLTKVDVSNFVTDNVKDMFCMFGSCGELTEVDVSKFNTSKCTAIGEMFTGCTKLTSLDVSNFDTSNVTGTSSMFSGCRALTELDLRSFDMSKNTNVNGMFGYCVALTTIKSFKNLGKGYTQKSNNYSYYKLDLKSCPLTYESAIDIITNGLYDLNLTYNVANGGILYTQSIQFNASTLALLEATEEGQAVLAEVALKGWTIS